MGWYIFFGIWIIGFILLMRGILIAPLIEDEEDTSDSDDTTVTTE
jgi:hypothetical protein